MDIKACTAGTRIVQVYYTSSRSSMVDATMTPPASLVVQWTSTCALCADRREQSPREPRPFTAFFSIQSARKKAICSIGDSFHVQYKDAKMHRQMGGGGGVLWAKAPTPSHNFFLTLDTGTPM